MMLTVYNVCPICLHTIKQESWESIARFGCALILLYNHRHPHHQTQQDKPCASQHRDGDGHAVGVVVDRLGLLGLA